jgi:hypothetical protein
MMGLSLSKWMIGLIVNLFPTAIGIYWKSDRFVGGKVGLYFANVLGMLLSLLLTLGLMQGESGDKILAWLVIACIVVWTALGFVSNKIWCDRNQA